MNNTNNALYVKKQISQLLPGDILLYPLYRMDGLMLINKYKVLTADIIKKVVSHIPSGISIVVVDTEAQYNQFIEEAQYESQEFTTVLKEITTEYNKFMTTPIEIESLSDSRDKLVSIAEKKSMPKDDYLSILFTYPLFLTFENILESNRLKARAAEVREKLFEIIESNKILHSALNQIKDYKDILLIHSINTVSLAVVIGLTMELTEEELVDLAITALIIDASLITLPKETFSIHLKDSSKQGELYQVYVDFIKVMSNELPIVRKRAIIYGIIDYYEHYDGGGYPQGKKGADISLFARILSIAHFYEENMGGYFENNMTKPREAIMLVWENRGRKLDPNIVEIFMRRGNFYKVGELINIPQYGLGTIIGFEDYINSPHMPIVKFQNGLAINLLREDKKE